MNFVLVLPLFTFLPSIEGDSMVTENTSNACYTICPPGYHKDGACGQNLLKCKKCENNTFTALENRLDECIRCGACSHYEVVVKPCSITNDVSCQCKAGYYNSHQDSGELNCRACRCKHCKKPYSFESRRQCQHCQRECLEDPTCRRKCATTVAPSTTASSTTLTTSMTVMSPSVGSTPLSSTSKSDMGPVSPMVTPIPWFFWVVLLIFLVLFGLLLLFTKNLLRHPDGRPYWSLNKVLEPHAKDPKFTEQRSHQDTSPTTVTLNVSEEFPILAVTQSPSTTEPPAHNVPLLPNAEHEDTRQDEHLRHWPAIVLYAIIKEVPLRRWKEFLRLLAVADDQLERVELEAGLGMGSLEKQYQMLRLWSQHSSASLNDVFSALHYMNLSGCAQMLQESLEKLQWRPDGTQEFTACKNYTDHDFNAATQDT